MSKETKIRASIAVYPEADVTLKFAEWRRIGRKIFFLVLSFSFFFSPDPPLVMR